MPQAVIELHVPLLLLYCTTWEIFAIWLAVVFQLNLKYLHVKITTLLRVVYKQIIEAWFVRDIWHKHHSWYFKFVSNFTRLTAREITYDNFEISLVVFLPNITTNHAITYTNETEELKSGDNYLSRSYLQICKLELPWARTFPFRWYHTGGNWWIYEIGNGSSQIVPLLHPLITKQEFHQAKSLNVYRRC